MPEVMLNDEVVNMYAERLRNNYGDDKMCILSSLTSNKLNNLVPVRKLSKEELAAGAKETYIFGDYDGVEFHRHLGRKFNVCSACDIIYFPYNFNLHWVLFIIDRRKNVVYLNNSMKNYSASALKEIIRRLLLFVVEYKLMTEDVEFQEVAVPQQEDGFDCGVFTINFLRKALLRPEVNYPDSFIFSRLDMAVVLLSLRINAEIY